MHAPPRPGPGKIAAPDRPGPSLVPQPTFSSQMGTPSTPDPKIFKTAPPHPENAPSLTLTPPQPEIFFFCSTLKLPCASLVAPLEKNALRF